MATAQDFIKRISKIDGVAGCLLVRNDGTLLAQQLADPEAYTGLLVFGDRLGREVMERSGFSHCRHLCFNRAGREHFYLFPIGRYLLGIIQRSDCYVPDMLETVYRLLERVSTGNADPTGQEER